MIQKNETILEIHNLSVSFRMYESGLEQKELKVISDLHLTVRPGEIVAIAGSSGSGKSLLASAILGILPENATVNGHLHYKGEQLTPERQRVLGTKNQSPHSRENGSLSALTCPSARSSFIRSSSPAVWQDAFWCQRLLLRTHSS